MAAISAHKDRVWEQQPDAESFFQSLQADALARSPAAKAFAQRLIAESAVRVRDIVDHIVVADKAVLKDAEAVGWVKAGDGVWRNPEGMFPALLAGDGFAVWLRVDSVERFLAATGFDAAIEASDTGRCVGL